MTAAAPTPTPALAPALSDPLEESSLLEEEGAEPFETVGKSLNVCEMVLPFETVGESANVKGCETVILFDDESVV